MTRIIYDTTGKIFDVREGTYDLPIGIPCLEVEVPAGKYITSVDVSVTPNVCIFSDIPQPNFITALIKVQEDVGTLNNVIDWMLTNMPV
jgi:hypothetical protein